MAEVSQSRILPPEFIEAAGKTYLEDLSSAVLSFFFSQIGRAHV